MIRILNAFSLIPEHDVVISCYHQTSKPKLSFEALPCTKDPVYSFMDKIAYSKIDIADTSYSKNC